jgi:hypothetical protein
MSNAMVNDINNRGLSGNYLYIVINPAAHLAGKFSVFRYYIKRCTPVTPIAPQTQPQIHRCAPDPDEGWHTNPTGYTVTNAELKKYWACITADGFPVVTMPSSIGTTYKGTSNGQDTAIANYLHLLYANQYFPRGAVGPVKFQDGSMAEYSIANANAQQYKLVSGSGRGSGGCPLNDNGQCVPANVGGYIGTPVHFGGTTINGNAQNFLNQQCPGNARTGPNCFVFDNLWRFHLNSLKTP